MSNKTLKQKTCLLCQCSFLTSTRRTFCYDKHFITCSYCNVSYELLEKFKSVGRDRIAKIKAGTWTCSRQCSEKSTREYKHCAVCEKVTCHRVSTGKCVRCSFANRNKKKYCEKCKKVTSFSGKSCTVCINKKTIQTKYCDSCKRVTKHRGASCNSCVYKNSEVRKKILTSGKYYNIRHIDEYLNLDLEAWALNFMVDNGRKPSSVDFQLYFNTKNPLRIPRKFDHLFIDRRKDSRLELLFKSILEGLDYKEHIDFYRNKRFLAVDPERRKLELDFFMPEFLVAFEIQDFGTHDRERDDAPGKFNSLKRGPKAHREKQILAESYGIELYEIWEDEFSDLTALTSEIHFTLIAPLLDCETVGNLKANQLNQQERRQRFIDGTIKSLPNEFKVKEKNMKVWWKE